MFKFKIEQHVWFLIGPMKDPEYLEGVITKQIAVADLHGSPDAVYEIQTADGTYDRDEEDLYASFDELCSAVANYLEYEVRHAEKRIREINQELSGARVNLSIAKKRLAKWEKQK